MQTWQFLTRAGKYILFQKVVQKVEESAIKYINIFQNAKYLVILVVNSYYYYQLIHTFLEILLKGVIHSSQIASHQVELRREDYL